MPDGSRADWLADKLLRGMITGLMRLPYERRVPLMGRLLADGIGPMVGYRRRAAQQLVHIHPDWPASRRKAIARAVCDNFGRTLIENYSHRELAARLRDVQPGGPGLAPLATAQKDGRPVIFVTGHFANHEVPRHVLTRMGYVIGGLYRPMKNPYFNDHYARTMTDWGGPVFAQGRRGTIGFARHIAGGGMGTLLFDVHNAAGVAVPFLGRPAMTATSAADLALKYDALVLPYFATRQPDGLSFTVEVESPITPAAPEQMMAEMTARLAARVTAHPAQWFWVHRRWKVAPNGG